MIPTIVVEAFGEVVKKVSDKMTPLLQQKDATITGVHYLHGHPLEVANTLAEKSKGSYVFQKYPLICLLQDFPEKKGDIVGFESELNLHILICKGTMANYKAPKRYDFNFKPFLYPIYTELLEQLNRSKVFTTQFDQIKHTKIDRLFWGVESQMRNTKNIFFDHLDIIEIKDMSLLIRVNYC